MAYLATQKEAIGAELTAASDSFTAYDDLIRKASRRFGVPWRWIKAIAWVESDLGRNESVAWGIEHPNDQDASASSDGKSWGIMQLTLATANDLRPGTSVADLNSPSLSITLGAQNLARLMRIFPNDRESTIRAYNGGPGFKKTVAGQRDTPKYYAKFEYYLGKILDKQPGDEMELG